MRKIFGLVICTTLVTAACGGKSSLPASPTSPTATTSPSASAATISGTVQAAGASSLVADSMGSAMTGVTVTVVGTSISSGVDAVGRFTLQNVPPGSVQLRISGAGTDATVSLNPVQAADVVDVVLVVGAAAATVDSEVRTSAGDAELEGRVEALPPTTPAATFKAAGRSVKTDSSTQFVQGSATRSFADLQIGMRVHARGGVSGDTFTATLVEIQNTNTAIDVEVNGVIDSLSGTASSFQFNIGSRAVHGNASTVLTGNGDAAVPFSSLKNGVRVEVKGEQRDGFVLATRIHVDNESGDDGDRGQDSSASIDGTLKSIGAAAPNLLLTVGTTTVHTSSATEVRRKGDVQTLGALMTGQTVHVEGTRRTDGSIDARKIEIEDDAEGGEFEVEGSLGGLSGTCPAIHFGVNGFQVITSSSTTFDGVACGSLKSGDAVDVKGTRNSDGSVAATRVRRK